MSRIPPVTREIHVAVAPDRAFEAFTRDIGRWWPGQTHSLSSGRCNAPPREVVMEARAGGALYEVMANGERSDWGKVTDWSPPHRVAFT